MTDIGSKEYLTVKDTALLLNMCTQSAYKLFRQRDFPLITVGGKLIVKRTDLDNYLKAKVNNGN